MLTTKRNVNQHFIPLTISALILLSGTAFAEETELPEFNLAETVVTATRSERNLISTNASVSVVTRQEIENKHFKTLGEAITNLPGVNVQNMGSTGEAYADNTLYINGTKNVVYLIDGVRVNFNGSDAEKFSNADFINMDMVEKIEVLKGAASTLYGSDAQGGVINIITRKGNNQISNKLFFDYGSWDDKNYGFSSAGELNGYNWVIGYKKKDGNEFKDGKGREVPERIDAKTYNIKVGKKFDDKNEVSFLYTKYKSDYVRIKPKKNTAYSKTDRIFGKKNNSNLLFTYNHKFDNDTNNYFSVTRNSKWVYDSYNAAKASSRYLYKQSNFGISDQFNHKFDKHHTLIAGFEYTKDDIDSMSSVKDKGFHNTALYVQDIWDFSDQLNLTSGLRFDKHSVYGSHVSKSVTFGYMPTKKTNYYLSYREFFIAPTVAQLYSANSGNPALDYESGYTVEFGLKHYFADDFMLDFNMYKRHSDDAIGLIKKSDGSGDSMYTNYDTERTKGFSANLVKKFGSHFNTKLGYTYVYVDPQENKNPNRNGYLPRGVWNIGLGYDDAKLSFNIDGRGVINREGRKASKIKEATTFWIWDFSANYNFTKNFRLYGKVNNIFDKAYTERVYDLDPEVWYSSPGRNYMVGIEYSF